MPDGREVEVRGRCDMILEVNGLRVGVEIKSSRSDTGIPKEHHIDQARIYNWLFGLLKTYLVYITPDRIAQYVVKEAAPYEEIISRISSRTYPRYLWECRYCEYSVMCPFKKVQE